MIGMRLPWCFSLSRISPARKSQNAEATSHRPTRDRLRASVRVRTGAGGLARREAGRGERCCDILPGGALPHQTPGARMVQRQPRTLQADPLWCSVSFLRPFRSLPGPAKAASLCISQAEQSLQIGDLYRSLNRFSLQSRLSRDIRSVQLSTCRVCCGGCIRAGNLKSDLIVLKDVVTECLNSLVKRWLAFSLRMSVDADTA